MVLCTRPDQSFSYITHADRSLPKAQQTVWHLRLLTPKQRSWVAARSGKNNWEVMDDVLRASLVDMRNLRNPEGQTIDYMEEPYATPTCGDPHARSSVVLEAILMTIPPEVRIELMGAALNGAVLLEEDVGN